MELRWYWRILKRQARVIWITTVIVAVLALLFTIYTFMGGRYKSIAVVEFTQKPPSYNTASIFVDPLAAAEGNGAAAASNAKLYTEQDVFFKQVAAYVNAHYHMGLDYRSVKIGVTPVGDRQLQIDQSASNSTTANRMVGAAINVLQTDFLPSYEAKFLQANSPAGGFRQNVYEPPIQMSIFDPVNARPTSLATTLIGWAIKAVLGFVLGVALAFLWEYLDATIHDEHDVRNWMAAPTLGVIPGGKKRVA
jgi:hypothetical protein